MKMPVIAWAFTVTMIIRFTVRIRKDSKEAGWYDEPDQEFKLRIIRQMADPSYLPTVSMTQLYDQVYRARPPLIENLLYLGKSFLMLQIAYHEAGDQCFQAVS